MPPRELTTAEPPSAGERPVVYCVVPRELAGKLHELLRDHFGDDPGVEVVVERRDGERRGGRERRKRAAARADGPDRRKLRAAAGRRIADRRAALVPVEPPELPRRARRHAEQLSFVKRFEPSTERAEDLDTARLVARFQAGDRDTFSTIYARYYNRVYSYLRVVLDDHHEAEDAAQEVFTQVLAKLRTYEHRGQPFRAWLFTIARNRGLTELKRMGRVEPMDPEEVERRAEAAEELLEELPALGWVSDGDLAIFIDRLPEAQRQVLGLRYLLGLPYEEIARAMDRSPGDVRKLHFRGLDFLRERLASVGREPKGRSDRPMVRVPQKSLVLRGRRFSLYNW